VELSGVLVQAMVPGGVEMLMGLSQDPMFGPLVAFGLGGIHVELLRDVVGRMAPPTDGLTSYERFSELGSRRPCCRSSSEKLLDWNLSLTKVPKKRPLSALPP